MRKKSFMEKCCYLKISDSIETIELTTVVGLNEKFSSIEVNNWKHSRFVKEFIQFPPNSFPGILLIIRIQSKCNKKYINDTVNRIKNYQVILSYFSIWISNSLMLVDVYSDREIISSPFSTMLKIELEYTKGSNLLTHKSLTKYDNKN